MIRAKLYVLYSFMIGLYMINVFLDQFFLHYLNGLIAIVALIVSYRGASRLFQIVGGILTTCGAFFFVYSEANLSLLPTYTTSTLPLLALLLVLPFINTVVTVGRYDQQMNKLLKAHANNLGTLYRRAIYTTYILTSFINVSSIAFVYSVLSKSLQGHPKILQDRLMSRTILGGLSIALAWSPLEILVAIAVDATGVSYLLYLPWLLLVSLIVLVLESVKSLTYQKYPVYQTDQSNQSDQSDQSDQFDDPPLNAVLDSKVFRQMGILFVVFSFFLAAILLVGQIPGVSFLLAVTLVIIPFSFAWSLLIGRLRTFYIYGVQVWKQRSNGLTSMVVLFVPLGFFVTTLSETVFLDMMRQPFLFFAEHPLIILVMLQFSYILMAMLGFHALATAGILIEIIPPLLEVMNPMSIGIVLVTGGLATATIAPYGVTVNILADLTGNIPYRITSWNIWFALMYGFCGTCIAWILL